MRITYIYHSCYVIEFDNCYMIFDYFKGELPALDKEKKLYIFASHSHSDHFTDKIFEYFAEYSCEYFLSRDIFKKYKITADNINYLYANKQYKFDDLEILTLKSTDLGVAFLIKYEDRTIFHSGDLHYWVWQGETKEYNNNMAANYKREIDKLKGTDIDTAFIPLDPRQGSWYYKGMKYAIENINIKNIFPMHSWEDYSMVDRFVSDGYNTTNSKIYNVNKPLDNWEV